MVARYFETNSACTDFHSVRIIAEKFVEIPELFLPSPLDFRSADKKRNNIYGITEELVALYD